VGSSPTTRAIIFEFKLDCAVMVGKIKNFVNSVSAEMKKVSWPTKEQLRESTVVVIVVTAVITFFVWVVDMIMESIVRWIF
jgi:preprotein translocase subunit SecE